MVEKKKLDFAKMRPVSMGDKEPPKERIKELQQLLSDIATRKREGAVYIIAPKNKMRYEVTSEAEAAAGEGAYISHEMGRESFLANFLMATGMSPIKIFSVVETVQDMREKIGWNRSN